MIVVRDVALLVIGIVGGAVMHLALQPQPDIHADPLVARPVIRDVPSWTAEYEQYLQYLHDVGAVVKLTSFRVDLHYVPSTDQLASPHLAGLVIDVFPHAEAALVKFDPASIRCREQIRTAIAIQDWSAGVYDIIQIPLPRVP